MDTITPTLSSFSRERGVSDGLRTYQRIVSERDLGHNGVRPGVSNENASPLDVSRALGSMLKTTTETGDIGMFSIRPSRIPQSAIIPRHIMSGYNDKGNRKPSQTSQQYAMPMTDDRRRLPSYGRDATSEVASTYETSSQRSVGVFEEPDFRSYSMTHTAHSSYTLSNYRSYPSLRSQPTGNHLIQRPKSPFAYPARLKRPGFRPSSPALTDGGLVDYSRRAKIERLPNVSELFILYMRHFKSHFSLFWLSSNDLNVGH
jgi:hypothetical protein